MDFYPFVNMRNRPWSRVKTLKNFRIPVKINDFCVGGGTAENILDFNLNSFVNIIEKHELLLK